MRSVFSDNLFGQYDAGRIHDASKGSEFGGHSESAPYAFLIGDVDGCEPGLWSEFTRKAASRRFIQIR